MGLLQSLREVAGVVKHHWDHGTIAWGMCLYVLCMHLAAFQGIRVMHLCKWQTFVEGVILRPLSGMGVTAGCHRLWTHRSYVANLPWRIFMMLSASMANQWSIYDWCVDHRVHHKYSETDADPHNATRGFFFAHMGWLLVKRHPDNVAAEKQLDFSDLLADPVVKFNYVLDPFFGFFMCYIFPALIAHYCWGEDFMRAVWVAGGLRNLEVLHLTWLVNSAAHLYGDRPYDPTINPAENGLVAALTVGEGWHNWHHTYPFDYACSEFGALKQVNPTKMLIDFGAWLGCVTHRKRATEAWALKKEAQEAKLVEAEEVQEATGAVAVADVVSSSSSSSSKDGLFKRSSNKTTPVKSLKAKASGLFKKKLQQAATTTTTSAQ